MDDLLQFSGKAQKIIIESAQIKKGTFIDKEDKKSLILEANYSESGDLLSITNHNRVENYIYHDGEMICLHVAELDKTPIYKEDYYYENGLLVKKTRVNKIGKIEDEETFYYNTSGLLEKKNSKSMTYEYLYSGTNIV